MPQIGDNVHVWPHPGRNVRSHAELNRMLPKEGMDLPWSVWLEEQLGQGMVHLTDPTAPIDLVEAKKRIAEAKAAAADQAPASAAPEAPPAADPAPTSNEGK